MGAFVGAGAAMPDHALMLFLPLLLYDCVRMRSWKAGVITGAGVLCQMVWFVQGEIGVFRFVLWCFTLILAAIFSVRTERSLKLAQEVIHLKDSSTELRLAMQKRQQDLLEKQDYEIHLATLQERNRIAREIHDNVGHMLSRSILQMGALQTIHKEEPLHGQLVAINDTLSQAMNNIRESVHDLHNESLDLKQALREVTDEFRDKYEIAFTYDMSAAEQILKTDRDAKILFLTTFSDDEYIVKALDLGTKGYILKQDFEGILPALQAVQRGQSVFGGEIVSRIPVLMQSKSEFDYAFYDIGEKEREIIALVGKGKSNREIADELFLSEGTVRNYISTILEKLSLRDRTQLAVFYLTKVC